MQHKLKIGVVGTGFAGECHVRCLRRIYGVDVEIAGVTSRREASRTAFGRRHGIPVFDSVEKLLDAVDILDICSPPYVHEDHIVLAAEAGKGIICEKPLTGFFGPETHDPAYRGDRDDKKNMLTAVTARLERIAAAVSTNHSFFGYAENFVYAPGLTKEREILTKTGAQILRMTGEESHNGSASPVYGIWQQAGGGSLIGKGCHPLGGMLYLKRVEGLVRHGKPIRPRSVSARTHQITRLPNYRDAGMIRTDYHDIEDYGFMHITFDDGTVADVLTSELSLGGIYDYVEIYANNHRTRCNISPSGLMDVYNPRAKQFEDIYLLEKISTTEGWTPASPAEDTTMGYQGELQDFLTAAAAGTAPQSDLGLALDTTAAVYAAYVSDAARGQETSIPLTWEI
ncbi:MAG: Gfo/Idh/MocA family oxidoreductase [Victivallales bacterium]|nr:Gfo/Idh/MocA family oxidoreductase [Victivallales bacterium]